MTRISFDISPEQHQRFKLYCAEKKTTITDEVTKFINKTLEEAESESRPQPESKTEKEPQKTINVLGKEYPVGADGKAIIDDLDEPVKADPIEAMAAQLKSVVDILTGLVPTVADLKKWREDFRSWQDSKFADLDKQLAEVDQKFVVTGKLIESVMNAVEQTSSATKCEDDLKGIAVLKGEGFGNEAVSSKEAQEIS